jgi:hypothetical protein
MLTRKLSPATTHFLRDRVVALSTHHHLAPRLIKRAWLYLYSTDLLERMVKPTDPPPPPKKKYLNAGNKLHKHNIYIQVLNLDYRLYYKEKQVCSNTVIKMRVLKQSKYTVFILKVDR